MLSSSAMTIRTVTTAVLDGSRRTTLCEEAVEQAVLAASRRRSSRPTSARSTCHRVGVALASRCSWSASVSATDCPQRASSCGLAEVVELLVDDRELLAKRPRRPPSSVRRRSISERQHATECRSRLARCETSRNATPQCETSGCGRRRLGRSPTATGSWDRNRFDTSTETREALLAAMDAGDHPDGPPEPSPPMWIVKRGGTDSLWNAADLHLEDGTVVPDVRSLPPDLPLGYHELVPRRRLAALAAGGHSGPRASRWGSGCGGGRCSSTRPGRRALGHRRPRRPRSSRDRGRRRWARRCSCSTRCTRWPPCIPSSPARTPRPVGCGGTRSRCTSSRCPVHLFSVMSSTGSRTRDGRSTNAG